MLDHLPEELIEKLRERRKRLFGPRPEGGDEDDAPFIAFAEALEVEAKRAATEIVSARARLDETIVNVLNVAADYLLKDIEARGFLEALYPIDIDDGRLKDFWVLGGGNCFTRLRGLKEILRWQIVETMYGPGDELLANMNILATEIIFAHKFGFEPAGKV